MEQLCLASKWLHLHTTKIVTFSLISLTTAALAPLASAQNSAIQKELNRRIKSANKAQTHLQAGDHAYQKADYTTATEEFSQAFSLLPGGTRHHQLRISAADRYATAATEQARALAKQGDYETAKNLLKKVTHPDIAPAHTGALKLLGQIDDPIRYNHALTPAHASNVHKVGMLLRKAQGHHSLGQYDRAHSSYTAVLRIDPYNKAARRGMETIASIKSDYYRASRDHSRASMFAQVDQQWELSPEPTFDLLPPGTTPGTGVTLGPDLRETLASIIVEQVALENVSLNEALDFIRVQSRNAALPDATGEQVATNIITNLGNPDSELTKAILATRINLKARSLPLSKILDYITDQSRTQWKVDGISVLVTPLGATDGALVSRTFRVPPNFISSATIQKTEDNDNPFGSRDNQEGKLAKNISITDFLKQNGVTFPDGATASYTPSSNTLIVKNTPENIGVIDQLVSIIADEEPVMVMIKTTFMRVSEERIKELGFDWNVSPAEILRKGFFLGGGTVGNGTPLGVFPGAAQLTLGTSPLTAGNRSGNNAVAPNSIDEFIRSSSTGVATDSNKRAPGILTFTGVYSGIQVQMMMRGLDNKTGVDVMAQPSTIARSGERSKIEIIREFIYPTEYEPPEIPESFGEAIFIDLQTGETAAPPVPTIVTPANPTAFETRNVGITVEVEPTIGPNKNNIELSIKPEMTEFEGFVNYGTPIEGAAGGSVIFDPDAPAGSRFSNTGGEIGLITSNRILMPVFKSLRTKNSTVTIQDGATIVLGGLRTTRKTKIEDKTPILGDIPLAGRLFRSDASRTFREAVLIMVTAELVDPTGAPWRKR